MSSSLAKASRPIDNLAIGRIIEVDGQRIVVELDGSLGELSRVYAGEPYPVGQFGSIIRAHMGKRIIYAFVSRLRLRAEFDAELGIASQAANDERIVEADLLGEGEWVLGEDGEPILHFERGVARYPLPLQTVYLTPKGELKFIYGSSTGAVVKLGEHVGSGGAPCFAKMNDLLNKHTAIVGSTGAGKSGAVAVVLHNLLAHGSDMKFRTWKPRVVILVPHDEYGAAFAESSRLATDDGTLVLPYWLLNLQETVNLLIGRTEYVATSQSNIVKNALLDARSKGADELGLNRDAITVDSPVPYRLERLQEHIESARPPQASKQDSYNSILQKLETLQADARLAFMMANWEGGAEDPFPTILSQLVGEGPVPKIVDLSGVPNEVAGIASAVIARTLFNLKVWQKPAERAKDPVLLVCEEAHRYVPNRGEAQYEAAQEAIRRIAKEGRKYGLGLMLVSQRPSDVEATVLSQCNSWIVLRVTNDSDREHVKAMLPDSMAGLTKMLSGLRRQEAIFVGEAATLPSRIRLHDLPDASLPQSHDIDFDLGWQNEYVSADDLGRIADRWRYQGGDGSES